MMAHVVGASLALALAAGAPSLAQTQPAQPPAPSPSATPIASAAAQRYSIDTKFSVLYADPRAAEVVHAFFRKRREAAGKPELTPEQSARMRAMVADMTPREIARYPDAGLDEVGLAELDGQLAQVPYPAAPADPAAPASADPSPK